LRGLLRPEPRNMKSLAQGEKGTRKSLSSLPMWPRESLPPVKSQAQITCNLNKCGLFTALWFSSLNLLTKHGR
jgi:hypothetical protein